MSDSEDERGAGVAGKLSGFKRWEKVVATLALCLCVGGLGIKAFGAMKGDDAQPNTTLNVAERSAIGPNSLLPSGAPRPSGDDSTARTAQDGESSTASRLVAGDDPRRIRVLRGAQHRARSEGLLSHQCGRDRGKPPRALSPFPTWGGST